MLPEQKQLFLSQLKDLGANLSVYVVAKIMYLNWSNKKHVFKVKKIAFFLLFYPKLVFCWSELRPSRPDFVVWNVCMCACCQLSLMCWELSNMVSGSLCYGRNVLCELWEIKRAHIIDWIYRRGTVCSNYVHCPK